MDFVVGSVGGCFFCFCRLSLFTFFMRGILLVRNYNRCVRLKFCVFFSFLSLFKGNRSSKTDGETKQIATIVYVCSAFFFGRASNVCNLITLMIAPMEK